MAMVVAIRAAGYREQRLWRGIAILPVAVARKPACRFRATPEEAKTGASLVRPALR